MNFPAIRSSTLWALLALALGVCALVAVQAQSPPGAGHSLPSLSRVERALLKPNPDEVIPHLHSPPPNEPDPQPQPSDPISISSQYAWRWEESGQVILFTRGQCRVTQGPTVLEAEEMVFWGGAVESTEEERLSIYLEGDTRLSEPDHTVSKPSMLVELHTRSKISCQKTPEERSMADSGTYQRGDERRRSSRKDLVQTQFAEVAPDGPTLWDNGSMIVGQATTPVLIPRRVTINPRYLGSDFKVHSDVDRNKEPPESMTTVQGGVNIVVENVPVMLDGQLVLTRIDLSADRAVIWTSAEGLGQPGGGFELNENTPFQVYLEGDIIVRQGNSVANASHAFYDIRDRRGLLMNSELRTYIPELDSFLRVRADSSGNGVSSTGPLRRGR